MHERPSASLGSLTRGHLGGSAIDGHCTSPMRPLQGTSDACRATRNKLARRAREAAAARRTRMNGAVRRQRTETAATAEFNKRIAAYVEVHKKAADGCLPGGDGGTKEIDAGELALGDAIERPPGQRPLGISCRGYAVRGPPAHQEGLRRPVPRGPEVSRTKCRISVPR